MQPPSTLRGIAYVIAAMACFAAMSTAVRWTAALMPTSQMVFLRNIISLGLVSAWIFTRYHPRVMRTQRLKGHFWRAGLGFVAMEIWFYSLSILPLTLATALSFTTPVFGTIAAMLILKEKAGWRRWIAISIGFIGVLIILRPGTDSLQLSAGIVLISSAFMALAGVVVKTLTRTEQSETIVFYMALLMTPLSLPGAVYFWQPTSTEAWIGVGLIALFSTTAHLLVTRAYLHAQMTTLLPFDFMRLIFTAIFAYFLFSETMDEYTLLGAAIIMASSIYIAHREAMRRQTVPDTIDMVDS